jgi:hypothetical protein
VTPTISSSNPNAKSTSVVDGVMDITLSFFDSQYRE